jgi:hypothetical protein
MSNESGRRQAVAMRAGDHRYPRRRTSYINILEISVARDGLYAVLALRICPIYAFALNSRKTSVLLLISNLYGLTVYRPLQMPMRIPFRELGAFVGVDISTGFHMRN